MKQVDMIRRYASRTPVFDTKSVIRLIGDADYAYILLNHLTKKGEIKRVTRGYYSIHDDPSIFVYCTKPAYLGMQDALSFHNVWEQETSPVILTTKKTRPGVRSVLGSNVLVRRISRKYFFGIDYLKQGNLNLPVSDIEKTFIDMIYFNEFREDTIKLFSRKLNKKKLREYLKMYDKRFRKKVIGIISSV
jgi:predicted transcriptional regulator of viral defense system